MRDEDVGQLADAYRQTLRDGDQKFGSQSLDHYVLLAMVTESASAAELWIESRVSDGHRLAGPLRELVGDIAQADRLGKTLDSLRKGAYSKAKSTLWQLLTKGTAPLWLLTIGSAVVAVFGFAHHIGVSFGAGVATLVAAGAIGRFTPVIVRSIQVAPDLARSASGGVIRTISSAKELGAPAEAVFDAGADQTLKAISLAEKWAPARPSVLATLRGIATGVVFLSYVFLGAAIIAMIAGVYHGFTAAHLVPTPTPSFSFP